MSHESGTSEHPPDSDPRDADRSRDEAATTGDTADTKDPDPERRQFLARASQAAMAAGLVGGYGAFGLIAGRYLYPARGADRSWQFVAPVDEVAVGESIRYRSPAGETINITRRARDGDADDFIALSSTCPHLGCQVHWQPQNDRYFCPCHNGTFDPAGVATGGPPGDAGQSLPRFPLRVDGGLLFIRVTTVRLTAVDADGNAHVAEARGRVLEDGHRSGPGHDPCLAPPEQRGRRA